MSMIRMALCCVVPLLACCALQPDPTTPATPPTVSAQNQAQPQICPSTAVSALDSEYGKNLVAKVASAAFYLDDALKYGEAGIVKLCVDINAKGEAVTAVLRTYSPFPMLDGSALYAVGIAFKTQGPSDHLPSALSPDGSDVWFVVPVQFTNADKEPPVAVPACVPVGDGAAGQENFINQLHAGIVKHLFYPPDAQRSGEESAAKVDVRVRATDGTFYHGRILTSAGDPVFDGAALISLGEEGVDAERPCLWTTDGVVKGNIAVEMPVTWQLTGSPLGSRLHVPSR